MSNCKNCVKGTIEEQIKLIGEEIKRRIKAGTEGQGEEILQLAQVQYTMVETIKYL